MLRAARPLPLLGLACALAFGLIGCNPSPDQPVFPDIRFTNEPKLRLEVAAIETVEEFHPTFQQPNVEHLFPVPPERAMENWVKDRLVATGKGKRARVRIIDASVKEVELPKKATGISATFTTEQAQRYDASVRMAIDILGDHGIPERSITAEAQRSQSVAEGVTPNDRERAWYDMTKQLMAALDAALEQRMRADFALLMQ
jgi:hypothetical protein